MTKKKFPKQQYQSAAIHRNRYVRVEQHWVSTIQYTKDIEKKGKDLRKTRKEREREREREREIQAVTRGL